MLTYMAGMLCFACDITWMHHVHVDDTKIIRIVLAEGSCTELWLDCGDFGKLTRDMIQSVLDSRLATMMTTQFENIEMFADQEALCDWMHDVIAMHPFTTPSEVEKEAAAIPETIIRRLGETVGDVGTNLWPYDAMKEGRASGFDIEWAGVIAGSGNSALKLQPLCSLILAC